MIKSERNHGEAEHQTRFDGILRVECVPEDSGTFLECRLHSNPYAKSKGWSPMKMNLVENVISHGLDTERFRGGAIEYTHPKVGSSGFTCEVGYGVGSKAKTLYCYRGKRR